MPVDPSAQAGRALALPATPALGVFHRCVGQTSTSDFYAPPNGRVVQAGTPCWHHIPTCIPNNGGRPAVLRASTESVVWRMRTVFMHASVARQQLMAVLRGRTALSAGSMMVSSAAVLGVDLPMRNRRQAPPMVASPKCCSRLAGSVRISRTAGRTSTRLVDALRGPPRSSSLDLRVICHRRCRPCTVRPGEAVQRCPHARPRPKSRPFTQTSLRPKPSALTVPRCRAARRTPAT